MKRLPLGTKFYTAPPAPVSMKDHQVRELVNELRDIAVEYHGTQQLRERIARTIRSAMLQDSAPPAPVSVPDEVISAIENLKRTLVNCNRYNYCSDAVKRLEGACRAAMLQGADGNSPVIPDGWVACSERMPDDDDFVYICPRPDFGVELHVGQYCECHPKGDGWYAQVYEQNYGIEWCPITVTHWMPLPAAPQQEVKP